MSKKTPINQQQTKQKLQQSIFHCINEMKKRKLTHLEQGIKSADTF